MCYLLLCAACTGKKSNASSDTIYLNYSSGTLESIDPAFAKNLYNMWTNHMVYNTLVEASEDLQITPSLARAWDVSADGLTYTFHLRTDVFFHDNEAFANGKGRRMVADDVVYSYNRLIDANVASTGAWIFNGRVAEQQPFTAINDSTVIIRIAKPFRALPVILSMPYCSIVPREAVEKWGKDFRSHPCGTGPFMFHYWDEGNVLVLRKNPRYWEVDNAGKRLPYAGAVQISFIDSKATEFMLLLQGRIDFVNGLDGSFKDLVLTKNGTLKTEFADKLNLRKQTYLNTEYIGFLTDSSSDVVKNHPQLNPLVRCAVNHAIDRQKIVTYFRNGAVLPANAGFIPAGIQGHDSSHRYGYDYNPAKALALLAQAGYPNGKGLQPLHVLAPENWADVVNFIATQLKEVGIPLEVEIIQANILRQQMSRSQATMFRAQWIADYPDAETFLAFFYGNYPAPPNYTRFNNISFNKWYDESMNLPDSARFARYRQMDSLVMSYAPVIPLFYDRLLHFTSKRIAGLKANPMNMIDLKAVKIK
ncbi:ABC transporter substrate-binding protein [Chitinophagaceae bacterium IBVUCB1]|nr:ABC transporter substrate-binding protein [Chitinophagaceae bacterium IBVUCB1]